MNQNNFLQFHTLTAYPASCLNRDNLGRPKTLFFGGATRLRISSQCQRRHWRTSPEFIEAIGGPEVLAVRTREIGPRLVLAKLIEAGVPQERAQAVARKVHSVFTEKPGKGGTDEAAPKKGGRGKKKADAAEAPGAEAAAAEPQAGAPAAEGSDEAGATVLVSAGEQARIAALVARVAAGHEPDASEFQALLMRQGHGSPDLALFGRMLASSASHNVSGAAHVADALTVGAGVVEEDYFVAIDDLVPMSEGNGAAHVGESYFGSGVFYGYSVIDWRTLLRNLDGDLALARATVRGYLQAISTVSPKGKQKAHGTHAYASYVLVEAGDRAPRSLAAAFEEPVFGRGHLVPAIGRLEGLAKAMDHAHGTLAARRQSMAIGAPSVFAPEGGGTFDGLLEIVDPAGAAGAAIEAAG